MEWWRLTWRFMSYKDCHIRGMSKVLGLGGIQARSHSGWVFRVSISWRYSFTEGHRSASVSTVV
jgi:hypothetical protein